MRRRCVVPPCGSRKVDPFAHPARMPPTMKASFREMSRPRTRAGLVSANTQASKGRRVGSGSWAGRAGQRHGGRIWRHDGEQARTRGGGKGHAGGACAARRRRIPAAYLQCRLGRRASQSQCPHRTSAVLPAQRAGRGIARPPGRPRLGEEGRAGGLAGEGCA